MLADKAKAAGLCPRIMPYSTNSSPQGLFLIAMNASAWDIRRNSLIEPEEEVLSKAGRGGKVR